MCTLSAHFYDSILSVGRAITECVQLGQIAGECARKTLRKWVREARKLTQQIVVAFLHGATVLVFFPPIPRNQADDQYGDRSKGMLAAIWHVCFPLAGSCFSLARVECN